MCWVITAHGRYDIGFPLKTCLYFAQQSPTVDRRLGGTRNQKFKLLPLLGISCSFLDFLCIYKNFGFDDSNSCIYKLMYLFLFVLYSQLLILCSEDIYVIIQNSCRKFNWCLGLGPEMGKRHQQEEMNCLPTRWLSYKWTAPNSSSHLCLYSKNKHVFPH